MVNWDIVSTTDEKRVIQPELKAPKKGSDHSVDSQRCCLAKVAPATPDQVWLPAILSPTPVAKSAVEH